VLFSRRRLAGLSFSAGVPVKKALEQASDLLGLVKAYPRTVETYNDTSLEIHAARSHRRQQRLDSNITQSRGTQAAIGALPVSTTTARW